MFKQKVSRGARVGGGDGVQIPSGYPAVRRGSRWFPPSLRLVRYLSPIPANSATVPRSCRLIVPLTTEATIMNTSANSVCFLSLKSKISLCSSRRWISWVSVSFFSVSSFFFSSSFWRAENNCDSFDDRVFLLFYCVSVRSLDRCDYIFCTMIILTYLSFSFLFQI